MIGIRCIKPDQIPTHFCDDLFHWAVIQLPRISYLHWIGLNSFNTLKMCTAQLYNLGKHRSGISTLSVAIQHQKNQIGQIEQQQHCSRIKCRQSQIKSYTYAP